MKLVKNDSPEIFWDSYEGGLNNIAKQGETIIAGCVLGSLKLIFNN